MKRTKALVGMSALALVALQALDTLVDQGTITSDQEEAVLTAITTGRPGGGRGGTPPSAGSTPQGSPPARSDGQPAGRQDPSAMFAGALDGLVDAGTITDAQKEAVLEALSASMPRPGGTPGATPDASVQW